MISQKANRKLLPFLTKVKRDKVEAIAVMIAASNIVIEDITRKGELVIKHLN